ncbi:MAG: DUF4185 domain-containing protein [Desulfomonilia bacterium]
MKKDMKGHEMSCMGRKTLHLCASLLLILLFILGCSQTPRVSSSAPLKETGLSAEPWSEADRLFTGDPHWLGGDGASSVDLGKGRILWLFGDSFINPGLSRSRQESVVIRNSIALQSGYNPAGATVRFFWNMDPSGPAPFFGPPAEGWYWPGAGIMVDQRLLIFLMKIRSASNDLGFEAYGWSAVAIDNSGDDPPFWTIRALAQSSDSYNVVVGSGSILKIGDHVYAFGVDPARQDLFLVRWGVESIQKGDLTNPQWWTGGSSGWVEQSALEKRPTEIISQVQVECTVHYEPVVERFVHIQSGDLMNPVLEARLSSAITGPWSSPMRFYQPQDAGDPRLLYYACKAHPELAGSDIVFTYAVNTLDEHRLLTDQTIYFPRFLKGTWNGPTVRSGSGNP